MAHTPQHCDNPCGLQQCEQVPAKIWELLRRNPKFTRVLTVLQSLDARCRVEDPHGGRPLWTNSYHLVQAVARRNPFAGVALEYLVPEPLFLVRHVTLPTDCSSQIEEFVAPVTVRLEEGTTADSTDNEHWRRFESTSECSAMTAYNRSGPLHRRGPTIDHQTSVDARLADRVNPLEEWKDYQRQHGAFTLSDGWRKVPPGLKRHFEFLWRRLDSREVSPITSQRHDAPEAHETTFFSEWSLMNALGRAAKTGNLSKEDLTRSLLYQWLAEDYRLFAIPKAVRSRTEARRLAEWLFQRLACDLPTREPELLGTPLQWDIFLTVEQEMTGGAPLPEALMASFDLIRLKGALDDNGQPNQRKLWGERGTSWQNEYRTIHSPEAGSGLIQRIFPSFDPYIL